ncbi:MAG TPA: LuxR C-terminal-related transcriptional regulator [Solirubrobacteraceae bacterium]|nr:LuxR C-terminal-related transcriptional regulator [Solirubrobacteraceae bacterium]
MALGGPLIGREAELIELERALDARRVVTVTGAGGCGKSRVALELAGRLRLRSVSPRVWVVELGSARTAEDAVAALLRAVGARERNERTPVELLLESVSGDAALLVVDNCEHLAGEVRRLVEELRERAGELRLLLTSRVPLGIEGELVFQLLPLGLPEAGGDVAAVVRSDAGRLFVERAASRDPAFALTPTSAPAVVRICRQLDGLPLAVVLAAARVDTVSVGDIADGLSRQGRLRGPAVDETLPRHRSLEASLDWSYGLLGEVEQTVLRRLSVFVGGCSTEAARAVGLPEASETFMHSVLEGLEARGLITGVRAGEPQRWTLLQIIGEYAAERLALEAECDEVVERHMRWFAAYATEADGRLLEPDGHRLLDQESPNLRLALEHASERDPGCALGIVASLMRHWLLTERFEAARGASAAALAASGDEVDRRTRAIVHCGAGLVALLSEDYQGAVRHTRAGLDLLDAAADPETEARCRLMSTLVLIQVGPDLDAGVRSAERAVELLRSSGDALGLAWALVSLAMADAISDRFDAARAAYEEFRTIPGASEHVRLRIWAEHAAAWTEALVGSPERALVHADLALALEGDSPTMTYFQIVCQRLHALARLGRSHEALEQGTQAMERAQESGGLMATATIELALLIAELMGGEYDAVEARARRLLEVPQLHTLAFTREVLAHVALARGDTREAELQSEELEALATRADSARLRALADYVSGSAAAVDGRVEQARDKLQDALAAYAELGLERGAADVLDELALLAASVGEGKRAARLSASAAATRAALGCAPLSSVTLRVEAARAKVVEREGAAAWDVPWAEGTALPLADVIAYARRARGPRNRPAAGWESLTPAERQVAQLAASGRSNPQIAGQLFMSRSTVKMHLSSVYLKLHIANRTELAAAMSTRGTEPVSPLGPRAERQPHLNTPS